MPEDLPLEPDLIKVLASDTRREILRLLRERNMTVTELSRELDLGKATVHEHLNKLTDAGLVRRKEDDRLWVYYEVSPEGKRMLNPQRTRFYLIVAVSVLAGIAAVLALALFLSTSGAGDPTFQETSAPEAATQGGLAVQVPDTRLYASGPATLEATVQNAPADGGQLRGYLVPADRADRLRDGDLTVTGIPLESQGTAAEAAMAQDRAGDTDDASEPWTGTQTVTFQAQGPLPPGEYVLFVRTDDGRYVATDPSQDNRQQMPQVEVRDLEVDIQPATWYQGIGDRVNVTATSQGEALDGRLAIEPLGQGPDAPGLTVPLTQGAGTISPSVLDALPAGTYQLAVLPEGEDTWQVPGRTWTLHRPQIAIQPSHVLAQRTTEVDVTIAPAGTLPADGVPLTVNGTRVLDRTSTDDGARLHLAPDQAGTIELHIGRLADRQLQVHPNLQATVAILDGPRWRLALADGQGAPAANTTVSLDGTVLGRTNGTGHLEMAVPAQGTHRLALTLPTGHGREMALQVDGWDPTVLTPTLRLFPQHVEEAGGVVRVHLEVSTAHPASVPATLSAHLPDGRPVASRPITVAPDNTTSIVLDVPLDGTDVPSLALQADPLAPPPFAVDNRTADQDGTTDDDATAGGAGGDTADGTAESTDQPDGTTTTVELPGSTREAAMESDTAFSQSAPGFEPVSGQDRDAADGMADGGAAAQDPQDATPLPGVAVLISVVAAAAASMVRRRG